MTFETALRLSEVLLALAMLQQSVEHIRSYRDEQRLFVPRAILCILLLVGAPSSWVLCGLLTLNIGILVRFQGPYNGGSDRMTFLILACLSFVHLLPGPFWKELVFAYLAVQLVLSYFISGWVKLRNPEWRSGAALADVFRFSAYPVSEDLRGWANRPQTLLWASWAVIGFEVAFPLALLHPWTLVAGLCVTSLFHLSNACFFGLNRFLWVWLAAYPSLIWFQDRLLI